MSDSSNSEHIIDITEENIFTLAEEGYLEILKSPLVDSVWHQKISATPLHVLSRLGYSEVLSHPSVDKVVAKDQSKWTPLHRLAASGSLYALTHPSVDIIKDYMGWTPLHWLADSGNLRGHHIKNKYPWFTVGERKITFYLIDEILETCNAERFIGSI